MQFLARSLSKSIRTSLSLTTRQSWALSRPNFSTSSSHGGSSAEESLEWPKPKEIPYQAKVENCIDLIGYVNQPVVVYDAPQDGKFWAGTVISHAPSSASESESESSSNFRMIPVVFEGDAAQTANCHLKKDDRIHISGQMFVDFPFGTKHGQANVQVMVRDFHYIKGSTSNATPKVFSTSDDKEDVLKHSASVQKRGNLGTVGWFDLIDKPDEWCDYRESIKNGSVNPKHPDFKKKDGSVALWLNKAPNEILSNLKDMTFDTPKYPKPMAGEESWKDLVENKDKWWDNRLNKINPKGPDFMHKETRVALWLNDCPKNLVTKLPLPTPKKSPNESGPPVGSWTDLVENKDKWWDNRLNKKNPKAPDFKHKETGVALWLETCPDELVTKLPLPTPQIDSPVRSNYADQKKAREELWKDLVANLDNWTDNRLNKKNPKAPDFKHKDTGVALWLNSCPDLLASRLPPPKEAGDSSFMRI